MSKLCSQSTFQITNQFDAVSEFLYYSTVVTTNKHIHTKQFDFKCEMYFIYNITPLAINTKSIPSVRHDKNIEYYK